MTPTVDMAVGMEADLAAVAVVTVAVVEILAAAAAAAMVRGEAGNCLEHLVSICDLPAIASKRDIVSLTSWGCLSPT